MEDQVMVRTISIEDMRNQLLLGLAKNPNSPVEYLFPFLRQEDAELYFATLWNLLPWEKREDAPRKEIWMNKLNRPYTYGRGRGIRTYQPNPFHPTVETIARALEKLDARMVFEGCFANGYNDERDHLGWHSDDDPTIDHTRPIAVITLYGPPVRRDGLDTRWIQFKPIPKPGILDGRIYDQILGQGSLLIMKPGMQGTHQHRIPKAAHQCRPRISLTYRGLI
jgi:alkylated DNA repair dioxygenase AlkB